MIAIRSLAASLWIAFGCAAFAAAAVTESPREPAEVESPAACSQVDYALATVPPGVDPTSVSPNPDGPTLVGMAFFVTELREIDAVRDDYAFRGYVRSTWCDPRRAFDPAEVGADLHVSFGKAAEQQMQGHWFPSAFPVNRIGHMEVTDRDLRVSHDGTIASNINVSMRVAADFDLRRFPFDRQRLELAVESFLWTEDDLIIVAEPGITGFAHDFSIPEWHIERVGTRIMSSSALRSAEPFSRIVLEIDVAREWGFYVWKIMLPMVIIVALSWSIFWMSDERLAARSRIAATGVLTIVAFQFVVGEALPRIAYLTLLDKVMITSFTILSVTVLQSMIVSRYQDEDMPRAQRIDRISRLIFPGVYLGLMFLLAATSGG
jgi:hypothetical protein